MVILLLGNMVLVGGMAARNDIRNGIVPNSWLIKGSAFAIVLQIISCLITQEFISAWVVAQIMGDAVALLLYAGRLWAAGDAKLFMFLALCIPQCLIDSGTVSQGLVIYFFIFIPAFCLIILDSLFLMIKGAESFRNTVFSIKSLLETAGISIEVMTLSLLFQSLFSNLFMRNGLLFSVALMGCAVWIGNMDFFKKPIVVAAHFLVMIIMYMLKHYSIGVEMIRSFIPAIFIMLLRQWAARYNYKRIPTAEVAPGMILSSGTILQFSRSRVKGLPQNAAENMDARLTEGEADAVRRWEKSAYGCNSIVIVRKFPFAILIWCGFMLWILCRFVGR